MTGLKHKKTIRLMCKVDILLSKMYAAFAGNFPAYANYWMSLSDKKMKHADLMRKLDQDEIEGIIAFNKEWADENTLTIVFDNIKSIISMVENNKINARTAMAYTVNFEDSPIINNLSRRFVLQRQEYRDIPAKLDNKTMFHFQRSRQMMTWFANNFRPGNIKASETARLAG